MKQNRTSLVLGLILLAIGGWLLAVRQVPSLQEWMDLNFAWPMWVIGSGVLIFFIGLILNAPGMSVPACIIAGIGGILYYQNQTSNYTSWSYMWALIPGFVGVGVLLTGLLGEDTRNNLGHGIRLLVTSAVLFLIFGTFLGGLEILGEYGVPVILILLGVYTLTRDLLRSARRDNQ